METEALAEQHAFAWDGTHMVEAFRAAEQWLKCHVAAINRMNVFPVPDGDTGTNMHLTLISALDGVAPAASCAAVIDQVYRGALMGARGNSGVILSQILNGLAQGLKGHDTCGPEELVHALERASATAYLSASDPREGTILTVIRETSEAAKHALQQTGADLMMVLAAAVEAAKQAVERTPELLKVLRDAGVVDAGGQGLYIILEGMLRWSRGESLHPPEQQADDEEASLSFADLPHDHDEDGYGYCTNVLLKGDNLPVEGLRHHMDNVGTSVVVVGDEALVRIHVHTLRPGDILNYTMQYGDLLKVEIANMDEQRADMRRGKEHEPELKPIAQAEGAEILAASEGPELSGRVGVVAVAPGEGFARIFHNLGVGTVVMGGQTMNPSTRHMLAAIESLPQDEIVILPNNSNVMMAAHQAAQQAAELMHRQVGVVSSRTVPQGIAAMLRFKRSDSLDDNIGAMSQELPHVTTIEITTAVRDAHLGDTVVQAGQVMALVDGDIAAVNADFEEVITTVFSKIDMEEYENLTIYYGQDVPTARARTLCNQLQERFPDHHIEVQCGGQPVYSYILAAE